MGSAAAGAAFKDTWTLSDLDVAWMGLIADKQPALAHVIKTSGLTHGRGMQSYLTMMAVRLMEMHRVLKPTGSIYLHCDPTASHYLKLLMDAIFVRNNFRNEITWKRAYGVSHTTGTAAAFRGDLPTASCITSKVIPPLLSRNSLGMTPNIRIISKNNLPTSMKMGANTKAIILLVLHHVPT